MFKGALDELWGKERVEGQMGRVEKLVEELEALQRRNRVVVEGEQKNLEGESERGKRKRSRGN